MCDYKNKPRALASIGFLCEQTQRGYFDVLHTLAELGVAAVYVVDCVPYYDWNEASRALEGKPLPIIEGAANHAD